MWKAIGTKALDALLPVAIVAAGAWGVDAASSGGLIRFLGGATAAELEEAEARIVAPSAIEFMVENRTVTQETETAAGGPEMILLSVQCPDGWLNGPGSAKRISTRVRAGSTFVCAFANAPAKRRSREAADRR